MKITILDMSHAESLKSLFYMKKYMGIQDGDQGFQDKLYTTFCDTYLSDLENFFSFGAVDENNKVHALVSFYVSDEEPCWYFTLCRSSGKSYILKSILDTVIQFNEDRGRLKFYTLVNQEHSKLLRKFIWSKENAKRYGYFDEFTVPERCKCFYSNHWELLFKRTLVSADTIVRCSFLKQEYRSTLPIGGGI